MSTAAPEFDPRSIDHRQKPLVGTPSIERLLLRQVSLVCPESRLCVSVIKQAFVDLCSPTLGLRRDARRFFRDGRLDAWCDLVDLNPAFVREIALKTGYLPEQETLKKETS